MKAIYNTTRSTYRTKDRLAHYRKQAAGAPSHMPPHYGDWRAWRNKQLWEPRHTTRSDDGRRIFADNFDALGEKVGDSHEILNLRHTGRYVDHWQNAVIRGAVVRLRCSRGVLYIPATYCDEWDGVTLYMRDAELVSKGSSEEDHDDAKQQAARDADHYAEREAEENREFAAKDQAEQDIAEARETVHELNRKALPLIREIKQHGQFSPAVCAALREKLADYLTARAEQFQLIDRRMENPWTAVENW